MHFHLPKPLHGWREFAGEVGIIVIGVLIALGAEQVVETIHWREQARETESALKAEIQNSANDVAERVAVDQCLRNQLVSLRDALTSSTPSSFTPPADRLRVFADPYATPWRAWARGGWESATASNALNRLPTERLYAYAQIYKAIEDMDGIVRREREAKGGLAPMVARNMTPEQSGGVLVALTNLDRDRADILVAGRDLLESAATLDIHPKLDSTHSVAAFVARYGVCRSV